MTSFQSAFDIPYNDYILKDLAVLVTGRVPRPTERGRLAGALSPCVVRGSRYRLVIALSAVKPLRLAFTHGTWSAGCSFVQSAGAGLEATTARVRKNAAFLP